MLVVGLTLVLAASADATVKRTAFTSVVPAGQYASLTVQVAPRSRCTIKVVYSSGASHAAGLGAKTGREDHLALARRQPTRSRVVIR